MYLPGEEPGLQEGPAGHKDAPHRLDKDVLRKVKANSMLPRPQRAMPIVKQNGGPSRTPMPPAQELSESITVWAWPNADWRTLALPGVQTAGGQRSWSNEADGAVREPAGKGSA